ncbi:hypothetical protein EDB80DRAFT_874777 [Ilyonectria destructans]|nr:hypothetical protein EDB80DRAFT_874777 [Ilyonectria destructans]
MWAIGINITSSILFATRTTLGGYRYGPKSIGFLYFTPLVAVILSELVGHYANDWIANRYIRNHQGRFVPEARLVMNFVSIFLMVPGLVLVGQALENHLDISAIIMGWGIFVFGTMISLVAITAYLLDSYPGAACEVAGFLNFARTIGGFAVGYFQQPWGEKQGYGTSFGIQAAVLGVALAIFGRLLCLW